MAADRHPLRLATLTHGPLGWREAGAQAGLAPLVLLHGIGSGAASWQAQLDDFGHGRRVLAWDAPGYGESAPLPQAQPLARDYAALLDAWLQALGIGELVLVGHSLGALVAAAWAAQHGARLKALVLASPARGYGAADPAVREAKFRDRVALIEKLGPQGLADARSAALCAPGASPQVLAVVRDNMSRVTPQGYAQAAHMLAHDDLLTHLLCVDRRAVPVHVLCGTLDAITPPAACAALATAAGVPYTALEGLGHACYVENPPGFDAALRAALQRPALVA